ncbi:cell filamentation protein Fic [Campylobacter devanensis]|uniref:Fic domain protein n=1 Tax=Campylobacter devanensis TaxID=3161138 RepID=A0A1X9SSC2_9BACT|nr:MULTISPECIES: Fic family protein [Campylobacter]ARQ99116.1 Fic domain protein [Campylobacter lanienae]SUX02270.1 cell filamentation protein Fic [Campylobacter lanienae]
MAKTYTIPKLPLGIDLETKEILKQVNLANKALAELKGVAHTIPNEGVLINSLVIQEAKESSEVENIVTTHDEIFQADLSVSNYAVSNAAKEVMNYREAMLEGFSRVKENMLLTNNIIKNIQEKLEKNKAGFRTSAVTLQNSKQEIVYAPPKTGDEVEHYMSNLEHFINNSELSDLDPLIKLAIIHHQFESIHPFYDGNGRTGRIISVLYLVQNRLLDLPILYLSRYITRNKADYYKLIQAVRDNDGDIKDWQNWVMFILKGIEVTSKETIILINGIAQLMAQYKAILKPVFGKTYKHELLNNLFFHPYTKIEFIERDMNVQRKTAAKYLDMIVDLKLLTKMKKGSSNYYINNALFALFLNQGKVVSEVETIESVKS